MGRMVEGEVLGNGGWVKDGNNTTTMEVLVDDAAAMEVLVKMSLGFWWMWPGLYGGGWGSWK